MPVRVLGKCGGFDSDIQAGILWAAGIDVPSVPHNANPARVINMSLGGVGACTQGYIDAIGQANAAGAVVVVSAGNSGGNGVSNPANCPGAIGVTGLRHAGDKVGYSDLGPEITISAPGGNCVTTTAGSACLYPIMTTTNTGVTTPVPGPGGAAYTDSFNSSLGTSFSAPLVSGTVALMLSVQPSLTPVEVKSNLQASARAFPNTGGNSATIPTCTLSSTSQDECYCPNPGPGVTTLCGAGMLDARAAVLAASGTQARISLTTTTPTANQAVALTSTSIDAAGDDRELPVDDPQRRHDRRDDHGREPGRERRRHADRGGLVRHPADGDRHRRIRVDDDAFGGGGVGHGDAARFEPDADVVGRRRRRGRRRLAGAPARRRPGPGRDGAARAPQRAQRGRSGRAQALKPRPVGSSFSVTMRATSAGSAATTR